MGILISVTAVGVGSKPPAHSYSEHVLMWQTTKCGEQGEGSRASWGNEQTAATSETAVVNHYILTVSGRELVAGGRVVSSVDELAVSAQDRVPGDQVGV